MVLSFPAELPDPAVLPLPLLSPAEFLIWNESWNLKSIQQNTHPLPEPDPLSFPLPRKRFPLPADGLVTDPIVFEIPASVLPKSRSFKMEGNVTVFPLPAVLSVPAWLLLPLLFPAEFLRHV